MNNPRKVSRVIEPTPVIEGAGVLLRRSFGPDRSNPFDPFLLFDHFAFNDPIEGPLVGFPMHPHRGIETVTYMLEGSVHHRDSLGNSGLIGPGDVQWMSSGRGILHEEMPRRSPQGNVFGFQLWVNLPASEKMSSPRYQEVSADTIPVARRGGAAVRVVAGEVDGVYGPVTDIAAKPVYLDVRLEPGTHYTQSVPPGHTALAYVYSGRGCFGAGEHSGAGVHSGAGEHSGATGDDGESVEAVHMLEFGDGDHIQIKADPDSSVAFMLVAGMPFKEPIVPYGPFVMNTVEEIQQTLLDLRNGTFVQA
ncbi:MAG: pirin family protein [Anaerolineales bacterium]